VRDISVQKKNERELVSALEEADRASKAKSEFLSLMSHELRTPMNAILGFGQLMEYDSGLSAEHRDCVQEILKAGYHLLELINEVLDLSRIESGRLDLSLEPVEVSPVIRECQSLMKTLADKRDIQIEFRTLEGAVVRADRIRLKQALLNLLSNAIKYNRDGGSVTIGIEPQGQDRIAILVTDTGKGVSSGQLADLFQPFHRLDAEASGVEGTGIGLTITRRLVELMGGVVDAQSEVGTGSTFRIELPLVSLDGIGQVDGSKPVTTPVSGNGNVSNKVSDNVSDTVSGQNPGPDQHLVLYIEDNPSNIRLVAQILGRHQHIHLLTAHTPELGIELARTRKPELILLDINLPGMDGYEVLQIFSADPVLRNIPVIAVTANAMPGDIERGMAAGFTDYLVKPLDIGRFNTVIAQRLNTDERVKELS
jgi:CheY-like chemotaxis protein